MKRTVGPLTAYSELEKPLFERLTTATRNLSARLLQPSTLLPKLHYQKFAGS
jgi:hypothetical protein